MRHVTSTLQSQMAESSVLICGLNGLGVEVAKNIILAGVKSCAVWDNAAVSYEDLSSQFYFTENDIGKSKAVVSLPKLAELNPYVALSLLDHPKLTTDIVRSFSCVVLVNFIDLNLQMEIAEFCHSENIKIVIADTKGVFGNIFCDFGKNFSVIDSTGEPAASSMLAGITCDSPALVTVLEETRHGLESGDKVVLSDIVGMEELNGKEFTVTVKDLYSFEINCDTTMFSPYQQGGHCNQVKQPISVDFDSYRESYDNPGMFHCDFMKMDRAATMHVGFRALQHYVQRHGQLPEPGNRAHAQQLLDLALEINAASQGFKVTICRHTPPASRSPTHVSTRPNPIRPNRRRWRRRSSAGTTRSSRALQCVLAGCCRPCAPCWEAWWGRRCSRRAQVLCTQSIFK